jgi:hypothetical protein
MKVQAESPTTDDRTESKSQKNENEIEVGEITKKDLEIARAEVSKTEFSQSKK